MSDRKDKSLPEGWKWKKLGQIADVISGQSPPGDTYRKTPDGLPFFQGKADFGQCYPVATSWCIEPKKIAQQGDILISVRAPVGPTNVADRECCIGRGLAAIRSNENTDQEFILFALKMFESNIAVKGSGSTFNSINREDLLALEIPVPPLPEQKRIAAILTVQLAAVEKARKASEARLEAARALTVAYLRGVFESEEAAKWAKVKLEDICLANGQYGTSQKSNGEGMGLPVLGMKHIQNGRIVFEDVLHVELPEKELNKYILKNGDLIFNRTNSAELVGKTAIFDLDVNTVFASYLIRFRINDSLADSRFVSAFINSRMGRIFIEKNMARAIGQVNISASTMNEMIIPLPALNFQRRVMDEFSFLQREYERLNCLLSEEYKTILKLPASLFGQAFSGTL